MPPLDEEERNLHDDYRRRHVRVRPAKPMRDVLSQLLAKRGYAQIQTAATCEALQHLSDIEHVRERPAMYIGDITAAACTTWSTKSSTTRSTKPWPATPRTSTSRQHDGSVTVEDDGRGIPVETHEQLSEEMGREVSTLEGVMTVLKFGGKFEKGAYQTSGGLHGVGVTVVNFLSQWCEVEV
jgi:DNA gyrase subunit B